MLNYSVMINTVIFKKFRVNEFVQFFVDVVQVYI